MDWTAVLQRILDKILHLVDLVFSDAMNTALTVLVAGLGVCLLAWLAVEWFTPATTSEATNKQLALIVGIALCFLAHALDWYPFGVGPAGWGRAAAGGIFGGLIAGPFHVHVIKRWFPALTKQRPPAPVAP